MKAVVLAAGVGERFYPFNHVRPKPMFPICNRPLLEWIVERLVARDIRDIGVVVGPGGGCIRNHFARGARFGCELTCIPQSQPGGTAEAVVAAAGFLGDDDFLVVHGDLFFDPGALPSLLEAFERGDGSGVAGVRDTCDPGRCTCVETDDRGRIHAYTWKPRGSRGRALAGLYAFRNRALEDLACASEFVRAEFGVAPARSREIADVLPLLYREGRPLTAVEIEGPFFDMDLPWEPRDVTRLAVREMAAALPDSRIASTARVDPGARIDGPVFVDDGATISKDARISGPAWIGKNTRVFEGSQIASGTVLGADCRIGPFAKVSGTVGNNTHVTFLGEFSGIILDGGRITHQMQLAGIFGLGAEFGAGTQVGTLRFDDGPAEVEVNGIRRLAPGFSGVLFGDYARTGVGAILMPGRIVGPSAMVGPGVVLMKNVPAHKAVLLRQELQEIDWPPAIYDR